MHINFLERVKFFTNLLKCMEKAASQGYSSLLACCQEKQLLFKQKYPQLPHMADANVLQELPKDSRSAKLLPFEWRHVTPLMCYGDGNCLYRYATIISTFICPCSHWNTGMNSHQGTSYIPH